MFDYKIGTVLIIIKVPIPISFFFVVNDIYLHVSGAVVVFIISYHNKPSKV